MYIRRLGAGIVNIVDIFRPQIILLGGGISVQGTFLTDPLNEIVRKESFGGEKSRIPEVVIARHRNDAGMIGAANLIEEEPCKK